MLENVLQDTAMSKYRTFWPRFWAGVVDGLIFLPLSLAASWVSPRAPIPLLAILYVVTGMMGVAYSVLLHGYYGQTLGKMLLRVKVLDVGESRLTMRQAVLRDSPLIVLCCIDIAFGTMYIVGGGNPLRAGDAAPMMVNYAGLLWFLAEVVTMLTNRKRRALHDWIAGSVVVRT